MYLTELINLISDYFPNIISINILTVRLVFKKKNDFDMMTQMLMWIMQINIVMSVLVMFCNKKACTVHLSINMNLS